MLFSSNTTFPLDFEISTWSCIEAFVSFFSSFPPISPKAFGYVWGKLCDLVSLFISLLLSSQQLLLHTRNRHLYAIDVIIYFYYGWINLFSFIFNCVITSNECIYHPTEFCMLFKDSGSRLNSLFNNVLIVMDCVSHAKSRKKTSTHL